MQTTPTPTRSPRRRLPPHVRRRVWRVTIAILIAFVLGLALGFALGCVVALAV